MYSIAFNVLIKILKGLSSSDPNNYVVYNPITLLHLLCIHKNLSISFLCNVLNELSLCSSFSPSEERCREDPIIWGLCGHLNIFKNSLNIDFNLYFVIISLVFGSLVFWMLNSISSLYLMFCSKFWEHVEHQISSSLTLFVPSTQLKFSSQSSKILASK